MASRGLFAVPEYNLKNLVDRWQKNYQTGDFGALLKQHWREFVLAVYQHRDDPTREEKLANKYLLKPLEYFLCNGDPDAVFQKLKENDQPSQLCGHVFKNGEPTYQCRECASDPTCVLCMDCFQASVHKKHKYRMSTSGGGGYCDCGDPEAWKTGVFCGKHEPQHKPAPGEMKNSMEELPDDLTDRASALFMAALRYIVEMLKWNLCDCLPDSLQPDGELHDTYVCMLFNDEVHTYEQVISTLQKAVDCTQKVAVEFATTVDREGRSVVKSGSFTDCETARKTIEHQTSRHGSKALKVQVMHMSVVAHQDFAMRLLQWLQGIISQSDGLRRLFCLLSMQQQETEQSLMEILLLADTQLWKTARVQSHQLMMAGVLMDQDCKKKFAVIFTRHYGPLMKAFYVDDQDVEVSVTSLSVQIFTVISLSYSALTRDFIQDDHYRTVSVMKMSVQIFTVPTLARQLVAEHNLLTVILETFLQACADKQKSGKLSFERAGTQTFKRACYSLHDLKYALLCKPGPGEWTDQLRVSFLDGFKQFLNLLKMIEGMDQVKRQTGQHLEFEPEWEGAFNLQLKLQDNIVLFIDWCRSDRQVLTAAYNLTLETLHSCHLVDKTKREAVTVAGHTTSCIKYDVSSQFLSIHLPVTRMLAGLQAFFGEVGLSFDGHDSYLARPDPAEIIELPLRVQVLVAQSNANMWRRNGFALVNQIYFYHNVKCRTEMFDRDIEILQTGAAMMSGNDFLIHLIHKFGLQAWIKEDYKVPHIQDTVRQTVILAEELLDLLIIILSERYMLGVGEVQREDIVKREVIHQLCISSLAHSELAKQLPEDTNNETGLEDVVRDVANFKKAAMTSSGQMGKGRYELKPEFYTCYNPYFYHYTRDDKSKSGESQMKRKKEAGESLALPPPVPPQFQAQYAPIVDLLQCDVMIHLMEVVLSRAVTGESRAMSETQLETVLHLIGLGLHEQKSAIASGNTHFDFLSRACGKPVGNYKLKKDGLCIQTRLERLINSASITHDSVRDLVAWTLSYLSEVRLLVNEPVAMDTQEASASDGPSPIRDAKMEAARKKKQAAAEKRRQKIMAKMSAMQKNFIKENVELFENTSTELFPRVGSDMDLSESSDTGSTFPVALGHKRTTCGMVQPQVGTCILCQEEQEITLKSKTMVLTGFVQKSTVLALNHGNALIHGDEYDPLLMRADLSTGSLTSSCGHMMHSDCWRSFFDAILARERRRPLRFRHNYSYDIEKLEFLCPLCECISNTVIPVLPSSLVPTQDSKSHETVHLSFHDWLDGMHKTVLSSIKDPDVLDTNESHSTDDPPVVCEPCPLATVTKQLTDSVATNFRALWTLAHGSQSSTQAGTGCGIGAALGADISQELAEMLRKFANDSYSFGLGVDPDYDNPRVPVMVWNACAFSIMSIEQLLRYEEKPLFGQLSTRQSDCLRALVKVASTYTQVLSPELAKQHCIHLLTFVFPDVARNKKMEKLCILDIDLFHYLVGLVMAVPCLHMDTSRVPVGSQNGGGLLSPGGVNDLHMLHLVLAVHLIQVLLTFDQAESGMEVEGDYEGEALLILYDHIHTVAGIQKENPPLPWQLSVHVRKCLLPFLRCAALLFHNLTGVPAPVELTDGGSELEVGQYEALCHYLGLSAHMSRLLNNQGDLMDNLVNRWCKSVVLKERLSVAASQPVIQTHPLKINRLITLPDDYSELINKVSTFTCPKSDGDDSRAPTMCLVCGQILCSQSYCCQTEFEGVTVGAATEHAYKCGAGSGIFLRVRECQILLLAGRTKGCFAPSPYIDDYGETDQGLRRGNPLHLCRESYSHLEKMWMSHSIPEQIAHSLESNATLLTIDWQHL